MKMLNQVKITFAGRSVNEGFALAAFLVQLDPTVPQLADMKTAVSEAVTNCIVHAYPDKIGPITMTAAIYEGGIVRITITDRGVGIPDIAKAMEPMFTTGDAEERAGLGFAVMQSFMDKVKVSSAPGRGTRVTAGCRRVTPYIYKRRGQSCPRICTSCRAKNLLRETSALSTPAPGGSRGGASSMRNSTPRAV